MPRATNYITPIAPQRNVLLSARKAPESSARRSQAVLRGSLRCATRKPFGTRRRGGRFVSSCT
ncbi:MAG: hypothetical protein ACRDSJ_14020, partial [Rubrobacteraceae bacterium]